MKKPKGGRGKTSDVRNDAVIRLNKSGMSNKQISLLFSISLPRVNQIIKQYSPKNAVKGYPHVALA